MEKDMENNQDPNSQIPNLGDQSNRSSSPNVVKPNRNSAPLPTERMVSKPTRFQRFFSKRTVLALFLLATLLGVVTGLEISYQFGLTYDAQAVKQLADYKPSLVTQVIADDGETVIGEFSLERRTPLSYDEIPVKMRQAVMAIEDARFEHHWGIDPIGIARATWRNFLAGSTVEGGSTLTQQLAKMLFLSPEKSLTRKAKEALLALQIERQFTKQQIMEFYCNQIFLGGGSYGIEAGAQYYFGKSVKDLELEEMALLAGLPKAPSAYSPTRDIGRAKARRNLVLDNMAEEGFISRAEASEAKNKPIKLNTSSRANNNNSTYGYFVEEIRQYLEESYGTRVAHTSGMKVYTTLNAEAQRHAVQAVRTGLHDYDHRHLSWRGKYYNVIANENIKNLDLYKHADWDQEITEKMYLQGLVMEITDKAALIKFGDYHATLTPKEVTLTKLPLTQILKKGDLAICYIKKVIPEKNELIINLEQLPQVAGGFICVEAATGEIKAMVGGYDFNLSKFNNVTQGNRQTGSSFKPFIYSAALEDGWLADEYISDTPVSYGDWSPHNYDASYMGSITLRKALAQSRNIPAVKLLASVGIQKGAETVKRFGISNPMAPYLPSALGATEVPLIEMVGAYSTFPNLGSRVKPHYIRRITDPNGKLLEEKQPETVPVTTPYVAATMIELMQGVVESGTAKKIKSITEAELNKRPIAGKTGTVNDFTDAWFIGYTPSLVAGFWIGYQGEKKSLGRGETGGHAALPVWIDFMKYYLKDTEIEEFPEVPEPDEKLKDIQEERYKEKLEAYLAAKSQQFDSSVPLPEILMSEDGKPALGTKALPPPPLPPGYDPENAPDDGKTSAHADKIPSTKVAGKMPTKATSASEDTLRPIAPKGVKLPAKLAAAGAKPSTDANGKSTTKPADKITDKTKITDKSTAKPTDKITDKTTTKTTAGTTKPAPNTATNAGKTSTPTPNKNNSLTTPNKTVAPSKTTASSAPAPNTNSKTVPANTTKSTNDKPSANTKPSPNTTSPKVSSLDTSAGVSRPRVVRATSPTISTASNTTKLNTTKPNTTISNTTKPNTIVTTASHTVASKASTTKPIASSASKTTATKNSKPQPTKATLTAKASTKVTSTAKPTAKPITQTAAHKANSNDKSGKPTLTGKTSKTNGQTTSTTKKETKH